MAKYECVRACTFRLPNADFDRHFEIGDVITIPDSWKGREVVFKDGKKGLMGVPEHFRQFKGSTPPGKPEQKGPEGFPSNDPLDEAMSGKKTPLSEITGQTTPAN